MYKYIIYCSISAIIIIVSKYVYQNWIKQTHRITELQNNIISLQSKIKQLEGEIEKFSVSGGVKIPIVFKSIEKKPNNKNINFAQKESSTIPMKTNIDELSLEESIVSEKIKELSVDSKTSSTSSRKSSPKPHSPKKTMKSTLDLSGDNFDLDNISGISNLEKELDEKSEEIASPPKVPTPKCSPNQSEEENVESEKPSKKPKEKKKKNLMPDAKNYNNGDKLSFEDKEYICVVGKRGGHSWKLVSEKLQVSQ